MLTALLSFQDTNDAYHTPAPTPVPSSTQAPVIPSSNKPPMMPVGPVPTDALATMPSELANALPNAGPPGAPPPTVPPRPAPKMGVERIAELHMMKTLQGEGEANEVEVGMEGTINDYAQYAEQLLKVCFSLGSLMGQLEVNTCGVVC